MFLKFDKRYFNRAFTNEDPWRYSVSQYEKTKYLRQIEAIRAFCPQPHSILEVGCAEGVFTSMLREAFPQAKITGIDISPIAITRAREACKDCANVELIEGDAIQVFCDGLLHDHRFDVIIQSESLHYIFVRLFLRRKVHSYLRGIAERLNNRGIFVTSNGINLQSRLMLLASYRLMGKLCRPELAAKYREWSDFRERHIGYDLRVFRMTRSA